MPGGPSVSPFERGGGGSFVRVRPAAPGGFARTGPAAQPRTPATPWTPPPLPSGSYNPERDISQEESGRGLGQLEGELGTQRTRATADYFTNADQINRLGGQQTADFQRAQQLLKQSYQRLGVSQTERANQAGVVDGGALLQSAAKRAANEAQESQQQQTTYGRQQEGNTLELAKLAREGAPPDATNPLGGRSFQDLLTKLTNAQSNNAFFDKSQQSLAGQEAAERGYVPPKAPAAPAPAQRQWAGKVRIGGKYR